MESTRTTGTATIWREGSNSFGPSGADQELVAFLQPDAGALPVESFERLQAAYGGRLDIEHSNGRPLIGRKFLAYSRDQVQKETERFRTALTTSLGLSIAVA